MKIQPSNFVSRNKLAFTLLEVMIAVGIFFVAIFAILNLTNQSLHAARSLEPVHVDATALAAQLSLTNRLEEGPIPPEMVAQFEKLYPAYRCEGTVSEVRTNGFFQVDFTIYSVSQTRVVSSQSSVLLYRPLSANASQRRYLR